MLKWLSKTFSIATAISIALLIGAWPLRADLLDGAMVVARTVVPPNVISSGPYTLQQSDAFRSAVWMAGGATATLPAASGFLNGSQITLCNSSPNDNTHRAILQPTVPAPAFVRLYMQQCETVISANGNWQVSHNSGRFRPTFTPTLYIDNSNGNDNNDGYISNAAGNALLTVQACFNIIQNEYDMGNAGIPLCGPTGGQTFTATNGIIYNQGGTGTGVIYLVGQGGIAKLRTTGNVVLEESDFAGYLIAAGINFDCTSAGSHPCYGLFIHQQSGTDVSGGSPATAANTFTGADSTDVGIWCDSFCKINSAAAPIITGTFNNVFQMDQGSILDLNQGLTISASATITNMFQITKGSQLLWSGTLTLGASNSVNQVVEATNNSTVLFATFVLSGSLGGGGRQWAVLNGSLLCNSSSTAIPGTGGINSGAGYSTGTIVSSGTSGNCTP